MALYYDGGGGGAGGGDTDLTDDPLGGSGSTISTDLQITGTTGGPYVDPGGGSGGGGGSYDTGSNTTDDDQTIGGAGTTGGTPNPYYGAGGSGSTSGSDSDAGQGQGGPYGPPSPDPDADPNPGTGTPSDDDVVTTPGSHIPGYDRDDGSEDTTTSGDSGTGSGNCNNLLYAAQNPVECGSMAVQNPVETGQSAANDAVDTVASTGSQWWGIVEERGGDLAEQTQETQQEVTRTTQRWLNLATPGINTDNVLSGNGPVYTGPDPFNLGENDPQDGTCADPAYAAMHPVECASEAVPDDPLNVDGSDDDRGCSDLWYAATHPVECAPDVDVPDPGDVDVPDVPDVPDPGPVLPCWMDPNRDCSDERRERNRDPPQAGRPNAVLPLWLERLLLGGQDRGQGGFLDNPLAVGAVALLLGVGLTVAGVSIL